MAETVVELPRGGTYVHTPAGAIQFGIPPESIKDSMALGLDVPFAYVVPHELFDRRRGISVAEFEFPSYYNFFLLKRKARLVVEDKTVEARVRSVFQESLFGPSTAPHPSEFADVFPADAYPDLQAETRFFRRRPDGTGMEVDDLVEFIHFDATGLARLPAHVTIQRTSD